MKICIDCKQEMRCKKNGVSAVFSGDHCYMGDVYECPTCKKTVLVTSETPFHSANELSMGGINMDGWGEDPRGISRAKTK